MSKLKDKTPTSPSPFDMSSHKTERTAVAILMHWMREIIEQDNIDLGLPDVETIGDDRQMPDTVIYESRRSQNVLVVIEAKPPHFDIFNEKELKAPAREKANYRKARYFAITNFRRLIWFNTKKVNDLEADEVQIMDKYNLSEIEELDDIEQTKNSNQIKKELKAFLNRLYAVVSGSESEPKLATDEYLVYRLQEKISVLSKYYRRIIYDQCHKDVVFANKLRDWFVTQGWRFDWQNEHFDIAARQTAYLLINKILFYNLLQAKRPQRLDPLEVPESLSKGTMLKASLSAYFAEVIDIDYETIYTTDFIDAIAFPDVKEVVNEIKSLVFILRRYDFSKIGYEIIGRIFERLIPPRERHNLGQYFTDSDIVDLILRFCLHHEEDKILDPSCGAGTFLVRAYQHIKLMNQRLEHEKILDSLWGTDIAKFPAHLATINLAINDLSTDKNYPNILNEDFFSIQVGTEGFDPENWRKKRAKTLGLEEREIIHPRWFDAIVGNPPYTRQEEIEEIGVDKEKIIEKALYFNDKQIAKISKRAGIHAYFFAHGTKFLKDEGYFGYIVSNSWLDVDYGKGLQELFLENYKIIAIIESKVERWFQEANINTCIIILQKCADKIARDDNLVRFVYLKKRLRHFIPPAEDIWEQQVDRLNEIDNLKKTILAHSDFYENEELRIFPKRQSDLWKEGFDSEEEKYIGAKWGKYLRAPEIFFKILEKGKGKLIQLKEVADVRFGIKTGANEFFYLTEEEIEKKGIEKEYVQPIIFSLKEVSGYKINRQKLTKYVIICHKKKRELRGTNLLRYIKQGEEQKFNKRPTCKSRKPHPWFSLGREWDYAPLIFPAKVGERMPVFLNDNIFEDKKLYGITPYKSSHIIILAALLNSTLTRLFIEFSCRQLTGSQAIADIDVIVVESLPIIDFSKIPKDLRKRTRDLFKKLANTNAESIFDEIAYEPNNISFENIKTSRRELDRIIMGDILGLTEEEQLEVYRAVVDLVRSRLDKAKSMENNKNAEDEIILEGASGSVVDEILRK